MPGGSRKEWWWGNREVHTDSNLPIPTPSSPGRYANLDIKTTFQVLYDWSNDSYVNEMYVYHISVSVSGWFEFSARISAFSYSVLEYAVVRIETLTPPHYLKIHTLFVVLWALSKYWKQLLWKKNRQKAIPVIRDRVYNIYYWKIFPPPETPVTSISILR